MKNQSSLKQYRTTLKAIDPADGQLKTYGGIKVPGRSLKDAERYCQENGLGYLYIEGESFKHLPVKDIVARQLAGIDFSKITAFATIVLLFLFPGILQAQEDFIPPVLNPDLSKSELKQVPVVFEYARFKVGFNMEKKVAEWVVYWLTGEEADSATIIKRSTVPYYQEGPSLRYSDYYKKGYDRGHLAPFAHFDFDSLAASQTFSMINIVPQHADVNRGLWKQIEETEKALARHIGCISVKIENRLPEKATVGNLYVPIYQVKTIYTCEGVEIARYKVFNISDDLE